MSLNATLHVDIQEKVSTVLGQLETKFDNVTVRAGELGKRSGASMDGMAAKFEKLTGGLDILSQEIHRLHGSIRELAPKFDQLEAAQRDAFTTSEIVRYKNEVNKTQKELNKLESSAASKKITPAGMIEELVQKLEKLHEGQKKAFSTKDIVHYRDEISKAQKQLDKLNKLASVPKKVMPTGLIDGLESKLAKLQKRQKKAFSMDVVKHYRTEIEKTQRELDKLNKIAGRKQGGGGMLGKAGSGILDIGMKAVAPVAIAAGAWEIGKKSVEAAAKYETYEAVLTNTLQSHSKAVEQMSKLSDFAAKTPFQIDELTSSYVKLANRGFKPTMVEMTSLGDLASSVGKKFDQLTEAILDAETGEFERMKEFGIKARQNKSGTITMSFKGVSSTMKNDAAHIRAYILSLGQLKGVAHSMQAISMTTQGAISNLSDSVDMLFASIGKSQSGFIKSAVSVLTDMAAGAKKWFDVPTVDKLKQEQTEIANYGAILSDTNLKQEDRNRLLGELSVKYPEIFQGIDLETLKNGELAKVLENVNKQYDKRINRSADEVVRDEYKTELDGLNADLDKRRQRIKLLEDFQKTGDSKRRETLKNVYNSLEPEHNLSPFMLKGEVGGLLKSEKELYKDHQTKKNAVSADVAFSEADAVASKREDVWAQAQTFDKGLEIGTKKFKETLHSNKKLLTEWKGIYKKLSEGSYSPTDVNKAESIMQGKDVTEKPAKAPDLESGINGIAGGGHRPINITINLQKLQDKTEIHCNDTREGAERAVDPLLDNLLRVVNSANGYADN